MNKNKKNFITIIIICLIVGLYFLGKKPNNNKEIGYYCKTVKSGDTFIIEAPMGTHFTKLIFADFGNPVSCPNPRYGTCTIPSNFSGFPFDVTKNTINGKDVNGATSFEPITITNDFGNACSGIINKYTTFKLEYVAD